MRHQSEFGNNNTNKRGVVVERDPKKQRVKVRFQDEDETDTAWVDVLSMGSTTNKSFNMPDEGDEVWCAMDAKGEDGCVMGSKFNDKDTPANDSNDDVSMSGAWGSVHVNKSTGAVSITTGGAVTIKAGSIVLESATLTHNGTDISDKHKHTGVVPGGGVSDVPV